MRCEKRSAIADRKKPKCRTSPLVTQAILREYLSAKHRADAAYRRLSRLEGKLIRLLRAGTPVELGNLTARAQGYLYWPVTEEDVKARFGAENYEDMKMYITPATRHELIVAEADADVEE
jgi:hypothetical protein